MADYKCPSCGSALKDWRKFLEKSELDKEKPFECVGFKCGNRWSLSDIQKAGKEKHNGIH